MVKKMDHFLAEREKSVLFLLMLAAYVPYFLMCYNSVPLLFASDEVGAIASAAYLAGRDWSGVISYSGYYGFGWYAFFWWIFKLTTSPFIIYRVVLTVTAFLRILIIPIAYYIMRHYLKMKADIGTYLLAALCPFLYWFTINMIVNEYMLELMTWVILLLMCKFIEYIDSKQKSAIYGILLVLANGYVLLLHTRAVMMLVATVMILLIYMFVTKPHRKRTILLVGGIAFAYVVIEKFIALYQQWIWPSYETGLGNTSVSVTIDFDIFSAKTWQIWFDMIVAHLSTETLVTGGIFLLCVIAVIIISVMAIRNKIKWNWYYIIAVTTSVICMGATIGGLLLSGWFKGMYNTWGQDNSTYSYKGMVYIRYWNMYSGPFIMCGLCLARSCSTKIRGLISRTFAISYTVLMTLYVVLVVPIICDNGNTARFLDGIAGFTTTASSSLNYKAVLLATCMAVVFIGFYISRHYNVGILLVIIFMLFNENTSVQNYGYLLKEKHSNQILASYEYKCDLDDRGIYIENIYLKGGSSLYSIAQFYFNDYTVQTELPDELGENDIIITTKESEDIEMMYHDVNCYVLDDNEVWYTYLQINE